MSDRAALWVLSAALLLAAGADCVASDRPLVLSRGGELSIGLGRGEGGPGGAELSAALERGDWALWPPVRHGPSSVRGDGGRLDVLAPPSPSHWLGTDDRGRDVFARLVHGARTSLLLAALAALLATGIGLAAALAAARVPATDRALVAACDAIASVPAVLVAVAAQGLVGAASLVGVALLIAAPRAADAARLARASLAAALAMPYCDAARALGASPGRVLWRHALPACRRPLLVSAALTAATAVVAEAALGFLGFGPPPPTASWGELLAQAHAHDLRWNLAVPAGLAVVAIAAAFDALAQPAAARRLRTAARRR